MVEIVIQNRISVGILLAMDWMRRRGNARLVEGDRYHFVTAEIPDIADVNREIVPRLPLNIERFVERIGQLIIAVVNTEGEERSAGDDRVSVWQQLRDVRGIAG